MSVERNWDEETLESDKVGKKEIIQFIQTHAAPCFLAEKKMQGSLKNVVKTSKKDQLIIVYNEMFENQAFKGTEYDVAVENVTSNMKALSTEGKPEKKAEVEAETPKFTKNVLKKGDKTNFPKTGDKVSCYYVGKLADGTVFDSLLAGGKRKKNMPLSFKVGKGNVIKGWDEALLTMSVGEKSEVTIEPEWAYGRKGKPEAKIPANATLIFEVELLRID